MSARPKRLVLGGRVHAAAIWIDPSLVGEREAMARALQLAGDGARLFELAGGYLCRFAQPRHLDASLCEGAALTLRGATLVSAPLEPEELAAVAAPAGAVVLVRGGEAIAGLPGEAIDPADWLDVADWRAPVVTSLGPAPTPVRPRVVGGDAPTDARTILGAAIPPPSPKREALLAALADSQRAAPRPGLLERMFGWLSGQETTERAALPVSRAPLGGASSGGALLAGARPARPRGPGPFGRWLRRLVVASPLAAAIGRRQARYLEQMLEMFEHRDWDAALRHAIPFSSLPGAPKPPSLGVPKPRAGLDLTTPRSPAASSLHLGDSLFERLKTLYRQAARSLEEAGRYQEAAYLLCTLLGEAEEGVAMLERHGCYELAARLAALHELPAGLQIRLWFLAGAPARAILIARRTGAYADAITRLERSHSDLADRLRLLWGDRLAQAGEYAAAVDAVWPVAAARTLAAAWVERAIDFGGPTACRMLIKKLSLWTDSEERRAQVRDAVLAIADDASDDAWTRRAELARALGQLARPLPPLATELARLLARRLMLDALTRGEPASATAMIELSADAALHHEVRALTPPTRTAPASVHAARFHRHERGLASIEHAVYLENGRILLALGEAGVRLVDASGRTLRSYALAAHHLALASPGSRVVAIADRGATRTLARIDLVTGALDRWCDARFDLHAPGHDGEMWFLTVDDAVVGVDVQSPELDALWRVGGLPSPPRAISWSPGQLAFVVDEPGGRGLEVWSYQLTEGGPALRGRRSVQAPDVGELRRVSVTPRGAVVARFERGGPRPRATLLASPPEGGVVQAVVEDAGCSYAREQHVDYVAPIDGGLALYRLRWTDLARRDPHLLLEASKHSALHERGPRLSVADDRGRVIELTDDGRITRVALI